MRWEVVAGASPGEWETIQGVGMQRIEPAIRNYTWGSRVALARLSGRPSPTAEPEAELWVGAHEAAAAHVIEHARGLDAHIAADPQAALGASVSHRFGGRLPFLLKILAAETALSIQAHPDASRASRDPRGLYGDAWPKPEAWVPLEESEAFIGSLPFEQAAGRLHALGVPEASSLVDAAAREGNPGHALLASLLRLPAERQTPLAEACLAAVRRALDEGSAPDGAEEAWRCTVRVAEQFPGDIGLVVLLTMRYRHMEPGECYYLDAGVLHTFVRGTTVEILANSDNVVRAGLTSKRIDVEELLDIVAVDAVIEPESAEQRGAVATFPCHTEQFALHEILPTHAPVGVPGTGEPRLVLAVAGRVTLTCGSEALELSPLEAAWIPACDPGAVLTGAEHARVFVATPGH